MRLALHPLVYLGWWRGAMGFDEEQTGAVGGCVVAAIEALAEHLRRSRWLRRWATLHVIVVRTEVISVIWRRAHMDIDPFSCVELMACTMYLLVYLVAPQGWIQCTSVI